MEGIILEPEALASPWGLMAALVLLAAAAAFILIGYMKEEERSGRRLSWAEWPLPESRLPLAEEEGEEVEVRRAA